MKIAVRVILYVVLVSLVVWAGRGFMQSFRAGTAAKELSEDGLPPSLATPAPVPDPVAEGATNLTADATGTNLTENATEGSNTVPAEITQSGTAAEGTNVTAQAEPPPAAVAAPEAPKKVSHGSRMVGFLGAFVVSVAVLGLLAARDFSLFFADKSLDFLFNDDGKGVKNPEYEAAEAVCTAGDPLEAVRMMRDYYERNPREVFVAIRIAEIYEKNLGNHLAAALEYEEILNKKLPPERWGWSAIHLCNLYSKMDQTDKAVALLRRVVLEAGQTPAAGKARKRLEQVDPDFIASLPANSPTAEAEEPSGSPAGSEEPKSNLPPGFRPKK